MRSSVEGMPSCGCVGQRWDGTDVSSRRDDGLDRVVVDLIRGGATNVFVCASLGLRDGAVLVRGARHTRPGCPLATGTRRTRLPGLDLALNLGRGSD